MSTLLYFAIGIVAGWFAGRKHLKRKAHRLVANCSISAHQKALRLLRP